MMRRLLLLVFPLIATLFSAGPSGAQNSVSGSGIARPGDIVRLRIWREPDLSGEFTVDETGMVVLPKIGRIPVLDESSASLRTRLELSYGEYLRNPSIEVMLLRRINVLGSVKNPGLYTVDPTLALTDVIALAGGVTPQGEPDRVEFLRGSERRSTKLVTNSSVDDLMLRSGDQLYVPERSWMVRNAPIVAAAITASVSLFIALIR